MSKKITVLALAILLSACSTLSHRKPAVPAAAAPVENKTVTAPGGGGYLPGDGPSTEIPVNLDAVPDAVPKSEPLHPYANRPYIALGKTYTPLTVVGNYKERGMASWYGKKFNGERTSSGEIYDMFAMTAAHRTLPIPSYARVTNLENNKSVIVRINDRGPFLDDRVIDLSYTAAYKLGMLGAGSAEVEVESLVPDASTTVMAASDPVQTKPLEAAVSATSAAVVAPTPAIPVVPAISSAPAPAPALAPAPTLAPVTLESLENSDTNVYLQLGAFISQQNAETFLQRMRMELGDTGKQFKLSTASDGLVRVHIGPYASQSEARSIAESLVSKLGFKPMLNLP